MTKSIAQLFGLFTLALAAGLLALVGLAYFEPSQVQARAALARLEVQAAEQQAMIGSAQAALEARIASEHTATLAPLQLLGGAFWLLFLPAAAVSVLLVGLDVYRLRRVPLARPDDRGLLPVARRALEEQPEAALALLAAYQERELLRARLPARVTVRGEEVTHPAPVLVEALPGLPSAPSFSSLWEQGFRPTMERLLLGYGAKGPIHGTIDDLLSTLVVGRPGTGKTTALRFLLAQLVACGAELAILDPHGALADDCGDLPATWRAETPRDLERTAALLCRELDSRLARRQAGERNMRPLLLLIDEWNILSEVCKPAVEVARRYVLEARKVRGYALISGQGAPAASFGGTLARDGMSSRLILWTTTRQAGMAGLDASEAKPLLERLKENPRGHGILARASGDPEIIAIPNTLPADIALAVPVLSTPAKQAGSGAGSGAETIIDSTAREVGAEGTTEATSRALDPRALQVKAMLKEGTTPPDIIKALWGVGAGRKYQEAQQELTGILAALV